MTQLAAASVTTAPEPDPALVVVEHPPFLDGLVSRVSSDCGADPEVVRQHAADVLAEFAHARIRSFIPILVEKQVRERFRYGLAAEATG
jgi:hypothetical protein